MTKELEFGVKSRAKNPNPNNDKFLAATKEQRLSNYLKLAAQAGFRKDLEGAKDFYKGLTGMDCNDLL